MNAEERSVPRDRLLPAGGLILCCGVVVLGLLVARAFPYAGIAIALVAIAIVAALARTLQDRRPALAYGRNGLRLFPGHPEVPPIPWAAIHRIDVRRNGYSRHALVRVDDPLSFMPPAGGLARAYRRLNIETIGTPLYISANLLGGDFDELLDDLERHRTGSARRAMPATAAVPASRQQGGGGLRRTVARNRRTHALGMAGSLAFLALGATQLSRPVIGIPLLLLSGYGFIAQFRAWCDPTPVLSYGPEGLFLFPSHPDLPPIPWTAVRELRRTSDRGGRQLQVIVDEPARFMPPAGGAWHFFSRNDAASGGRLWISAAAIREDFDRLTAELEQLRAAGRGQA